MKNRAFDKSHYADWRDPHELVPYGKNAKIHDDKQVKNIANSIRRFGWQQEAVITSDNVLVIGHGRRLAAINIGCEIPVKVIDKEADELTDKDIRELRIADNLTNESPWDLDLLTGELADLDFEGFDFDVELDEEPEPEVVEDYYDREPPAEPKSQRGDLYLLGEHRLFCGDSTSQEDVDRLMGGDIADVFLTDPPYNVDYTGGTGMKIMNDHMEQNRFRQFLTDAFTTADQVMRPGAAFYIWHADSNRGDFLAGCDAVGWEIRQALVWVKNSLVLGRQDYQWRHEPCLYGWKDGRHYFIDDRSESTVIDDKIDVKKLKKDEAIALLQQLMAEKHETTVIYEDKPVSSNIHPTSKPVRLMARLAKNSSKRGGIILDLFAGSGSTLIACEQLQRRSYNMELDPKYVDAIIDRYQEFTGKTVIRIRNGEETEIQPEHTIPERDKRDLLTGG